MELKEIKLPNEVEYILNTLNENGHEAFIVGGCVRDSYMDKIPMDWDITTSADTGEVKEIFKRTIDTGIKHGTVSVLLNKKCYEVTTYRIDGTYTDNRHPENVSFTKDIAEDLKRRDFTMNAIAYHPQKGFIDLFDGISDIQNKIICCVKNPEERFDEDALRMMRAVRFSAQLNFEIEQETFKAIQIKSKNIVNISKERIREEMTKLLISSNPEKIITMKECGLLQYIIPEFMVCFDTKQNNPYHIFDVANHILQAVCNVEKNVALRWTMLLHDIAKPLCKTTDEQGIDHFYNHPERGAEMSKQILTRLKFDNDTIKNVHILVYYHDDIIENNKKSVRKIVSKIGEQLFLDLLKVKIADAKGKNPIYLEQTLQHIENLRKLYVEIKDNNECMSKKDLKLNGQDLLNLGIPQGKKIGETIDKLFEIVLENPVYNDKEKLIEWINKNVL